MWFPPLRIWLVTLWVACIGGAIVVVGLALGNYSWTPFVIGAVVGLLVGIPAGLANWAYLRPRRSREAGLNPW